MSRHRLSTVFCGDGHLYARWAGWVSFELEGGGASASYREHQGDGSFERCRQRDDVCGAALARRSRRKVSGRLGTSSILDADCFPGS
jgi:hypothetical protein